MFPEHLLCAAPWAGGCEPHSSPTMKCFPHKQLGEELKANIYRTNLETLEAL